MAYAVTHEINEFTTQSNEIFPQDTLLDRYQAEYDYNGGFAQDVDMADLTRTISARKVG